MTERPSSDSRPWHVPPRDVPDETLREWQSIVDMIAELADIPSALIMRLDGPDIEVLLSSDTTDNPYRPGDSEHFFGSGLYCETAIRSGEKLLVPDAPADPEWAENPDIELGMIAYLGYPIRLPEGTPFGTICVLDRKPNEFSETVDELVQRFRNLIEHHLGLLEISRALGAENAGYRAQLEEIETLKGMIPVCAWCRNVRSGEGYWKTVQEYLDTHPDIVWTHGICPRCAERLGTESREGG